jgi:hypothetical protein
MQGISGQSDDSGTSAAGRIPDLPARERRQTTGCGVHVSALRAKGR